MASYQKLLGRFQIAQQLGPEATVYVMMYAKSRHSKYLLGSFHPGRFQFSVTRIPVLIVCSDKERKEEREGKWNHFKFYQKENGLIFCILFTRWRIKELLIRMN